MIEQGNTLRHLAQAGNMRQFFTEVYCRPFRFSPGQQAYWQGFAETKGQWPKTSRLDPYIETSQEGDPLKISMNLGLAGNIINSEDGVTDSSVLRLVTAGNLLRNLAWHEGNHLNKVVAYAGRLVSQHSALLVREAGAGAIKNASYYEGSHVQRAVETALGISPTDSVRMRDEAVRTVQYASRHSAPLLQTEQVRQFLENESLDNNPFIAGAAREAYSTIF